MKEYFSIVLKFILGLVTIYAVTFMILKYFEPTPPEVKNTSYSIYKMKESEVVKISFEENKCEVFAKVKTGVYHSLDFEVCPQVKIGDKVRIIVEIMK